MEFNKELHYITPIENVPSILEYGILSNHGASEIPHKSVANEGVNSRREDVVIPGGSSLHKYVNLYFNARNPMMYTLKCNSDVSELCILIIDSIVMDIPDTVISDQNAARDYTSFQPYPKGLEMLDFDQIYAKYWTDKDPIIQELNKGIMCAEALVPHCVSIEYIKGAYVLNSKAEDELRQVGFEGEITIRPYMFFRGPQ